MKLINDFYTIEQKMQRDLELEFRLRLNREHFIYRAHFPGNPIMPGVCIIQMCQELLELHTGKQLALKKAANVKFLSVIKPDEINHISVFFSKIEEDEMGYKLSATVRHELMSFAKLSLYFQHVAD